MAKIRPKELPDRMTVEFLVHKKSHLQLEQMAFDIIREKVILVQLLL